jgi:succinate dehydrogenase/fumarate reductase flavoprotein subunit
VTLDSYEVKSCDVLVIGGGGSGVLAALESSTEESLSVVLISRGPVGQSGLTPTANGGALIAGPDVDPSILFEEMVYAGRFLNDQDVIWFMNYEAGPCLEKLKSYGMPVIRFAPKSVCVPAIETLKRAREILKSRPNVTLMEDMLVTQLVSKDGRVCGAIVLDLRTGRLLAVSSRATVLATGGMSGELYLYSSNNPFGISTDAAGTGHALAYRVGAELVDMEMVQFVPLPSGNRFLNFRYFPEFWLGPYMNSRGEIVEGNVMQYPGNFYSFQLAQKLYREIEMGNGPIYIDRRGIHTENQGPPIRCWANRRNLIQHLDIDPLAHKIEIVIGSHFNAGGIHINANSETNIPGLFAAGEVTGNINGALRLAGISFTQMIVFGFESGKQAALFAMKDRNVTRLHEDEVKREQDRIAGFFNPGNKIRLTDLRRQLQKTMERHFFIVRTMEGMHSGIEEIKAIKAQIPGISVPLCKRFNLEWARAIEFELLVQIAEITAASAIAREESRGFHKRTDFPDENNEKWLVHTVARRDEGKLTIGRRPVIITRLSPGVSSESN